jgi:Xaa-Pro aminopeptidase
MKCTTLLPSPTKVTGADSFYTHPARRQLAARLRRMTPGIVLKDARRDLMQMRQIKLPEEVRAIRQAIDITNSALTEVQANLGRFTNEMEIEAELDRSFRLHGAGHAYAPIIAAGGNATTLHYIRNNASLASEHSLLLDVGAEVENYAADITRCYPIGAPNKTVARGLRSCRIRPGSGHRDAARWPVLAHVRPASRKARMGEELQKLGLVTGGHAYEAVRSYFPHGVSHSLGLDVHDVCDYTEIRENMVITVEPGIYIPEEGIGIRIEDDILITKAGAEVLSKPLPV